MSIRLAFTTAMMIFVCTLTTQRSHAAPPQLDTPEARQPLNGVCWQKLGLRGTRLDSENGWASSMCRGSVSR